MIRLHNSSDIREKEKFNKLEKSLFQAKLYFEYFLFCSEHGLVDPEYMHKIAFSRLVNFSQIAEAFTKAKHKLKGTGSEYVRQPFYEKIEKIVEKGNE